MNLQNLNLIEQIIKDCNDHITLDQQSAKRFFKTQDNDYGAHDQFLGITIPSLRKIAKPYISIDLAILQELLKSPYNEIRLLALIILVHQYQGAQELHKETLYAFFMHNMKYVNNWNLVDSCAHHIMGHFLFDKDRCVLFNLARSNELWERRISIVATWYFIKNGDTSTTFDIAKLLLNDSHDLIHKAVGWMLREAGKQDWQKLMNFLKIHATHMPRTMLRYAVERILKDQNMSLSQLLLILKSD